MPDPVLLALVHILVFKEKRAFAAKQRHEAPEEQKCEDVKWPQSDEATKDEDELVAWQLSIVEFHSD